MQIEWQTFRLRKAKRGKRKKPRQLRVSTSGFASISLSSPMISPSSSVRSPFPISQSNNSLKKSRNYINKIKWMYLLCTYIYIFVCNYWLNCMICEEGFAVSIVWIYCWMNEWMSGVCETDDTSTVATRTSQLVIPMSERELALIKSRVLNHWA